LQDGTAGALRGALPLREHFLSQTSDKTGEPA